MKIIVGLGNPGEKYKNNRHNVGRMFVDFIAKLLNCSIVKKNRKYTAIEQSNNRTIVLIKPEVFMNNSGLAVKNLSKVYSLKSKNLIVVHDDLDIPLGKFKIQKGVGPKLHNGIESIEKTLGTKDFWRVRIGVDNRTSDSWIDGETYVLSDFTSGEYKIIVNEFEKIYRRLKLDFLDKLNKHNSPKAL